MISVFVGLICLAIGVGWREEWELIKKVKKMQVKEVQGGVVIPSYQVPKTSGEIKQPTKKVVINPKSPEQLEAERQREAFKNGLIEGALNPWER